MPTIRDVWVNNCVKSTDGSNCKKAGSNVLLNVPSSAMHGYSLKLI